MCAACAVWHTPKLQNPDSNNVVVTLTALEIGSSGFGQLCYRAMHNERMQKWNDDVLWLTAYMFCFQRDSLGRFKDLTGVTAGWKSQVDLETSWSIPFAPYMHYTIAISLNMAEKISTSSHGYAALQQTRAHISREDIRHSEERQTILEISVWQWPRFKSLRVQAQQQHWLANVLISLTIIIYGISKNMACLRLRCCVLCYWTSLKVLILSYIYFYLFVCTLHPTCTMSWRSSVSSPGRLECLSAMMRDFPRISAPTTTSTTARRYQ